MIKRLQKEQSIKMFNKILVVKAQRDLMVAVAYLTVSDSVDDCAAPGWPV